ncbi:MAG: stage II sporulation protein D [Ruminococcaceae bacterium]|nr:stage II sporulation protein D [Oscillospiraceae bacterium]
MGKYYPEILMALVMALAVTVIFAPAAAVPPELPRKEVCVEQEDKLPESYDQTHSILLRQGDACREISLRDYLIGVVMSELMLSFEEEAMQAQAIASRTFALRCEKHDGANVCADSGCCQAWGDQETLSQRCGKDYEAFYRKAAAAVDATDGLVLKYQGELIDATFFACSGGMTEDAVAVWGAEVPYLRSVDSPGEEFAGCYHSTADVTPREFSARILQSIPEADLSGDPASWLGTAERTEGDGVKQMMIGGVAVDGVELRRIFGLKSTRFTVTYKDSVFSFDVYGYGHRVGMSQYGAQAMAQAGADAKTILESYYTGVEIVAMAE